MPTAIPFVYPMRLAASRSQLIAAAVITLSVILFYRFGFHMSGLRMDEALLLVYPDQISKGRLPYRDFESYYGPGSFWLLAVVYKIFGISVGVERIVGLIYRIALALAFFFLASRWSIALGSIAALLCVWLALPLHLVALAWLPAVALALWSFWWGQPVDSPSEASIPWRDLVSGVLAGISLLFRQDIGLAVAAAGGLLLFGKSWRQRRWYCAGFLVALFPLGLLALIIGIRPIVENLFVHPIVVSSAGRRLPVTGPFFAYSLVSIGIGVVALLASLTAVRRGIAQSSAKLLLVVSVFALALSSQALQRADEVHLAMFACISVPWAFVCISFLSSSWRPKWNVFIVMVVTLAVLLGLISFAQPKLLRDGRSVLLALFRSDLGIPPVATIRGREFPAGNAEDVRAINLICERLLQEGSQGQRLFVGPRDLRRAICNDTFLYYLLPDFTPASYFLEMNPLSANGPHSHLADELKTADWIILTTMWDNWIEPNASSQLGPDTPLRVVATEFILIAHEGAYSLFQRKR